MGRTPEGIRHIVNLMEACLLHHGANDAVYRDWAKVCMKWVRNHFDWGLDKPPSKRVNEKPQYDLDKRESGMGSVTRLSDVVKKIC